MTLRAFLFLPLLWLLLQCPAAIGASLLRLGRKGSSRTNCSCAVDRPQAPVSAADAPFSCCDVRVQFPEREAQKKRETGGANGPAVVVLEQVGLKGSGVMGIEAMAEAGPSVCLTASPKEDSVQGYGLHLQTCESSMKTSREEQQVVHNKDPELLQRQMFQLMPNGEVRSMRGLCVRRMHCGTGNRYVYDLGRCDGPGYVAKFQVQKPLMNTLEHLLVLGQAYKAVQDVTCTRCGPFMVIESCLTRGAEHPSNVQCGNLYQAKPGFTKLPTQYIGDAAVQGRAPRIDGVDTVSDRMNPHDVAQAQIDLAGLTSTDFDGLCGSYVTDGLAMESFFFFHRIPTET